MNWYKKSQYEVEEHQATPIPALPKDFTPVRDDAKIISPLPDTPEEKYHIFGQIDPGTGHIDSEKVPLRYAKTWGDKRGIRHIDLFGYEPLGAYYTWRVIGNTVEWYGDPDDDLKFKVEDHLYRVYKLEDVKHKTY